MDILFATTNKGKMKEVKEIIANHNIFSLDTINQEFNVVEDGETFIENATKKALEIHRATGKKVMADDSGLEIDFLNKEPGVKSARFMGEDTSYEIKNAKILEMLDGVPREKRTARFVCAIVLVMSENEIYSTLGTVEGEISFEPKGYDGFGYDPIFFIPEYDTTMAEISIDEKNDISHRGKALRDMLEIMENKNIY